MRSVAFGLSIVAACSEAVPDRIDEDYTAWPDQGGLRLDVQGRAPGHADSYRIIYVNPIGADPAQPLLIGYQEGSIIVKEIRANNDGQPGDLDYIAIMRRVGPVEAALVDEGGWLFTETDEPNGPEVYFGFCWARCHAAAPYNGAWYDYRRP